MRTILLLLFSITTILGFSQDKIVKKTGEEIFCQITKINLDSIFYVLPQKDPIKIFYSLERSKVKSYHFNVSKPVKSEPKEFDYANPNYTTNSEESNTVAPPTGLNRFSIGLSGGFSYLLVRLDDEDQSGLKSYYKELKTGYHFSGDVFYYLHGEFGLGLMCSNFRTSNSAEIYIEYPNGAIRTGLLNDNISTLFIGPAVSAQFLPTGSSNPFVINASLGYFGYDNDGYLIDPIKMTGSTVGLAIDFGYNIKLDKNLFLSLDMGFVFGSLSEADIEYNGVKERVKFPEGQQENMSRFDVSIGLKFGK